MVVVDMQIIVRHNSKAVRGKHKRLRRRYGAKCMIVRSRRSIT